MASFDCDVLVIGSGFGGAVAALRASEKGHRVIVLESGRRFADQDFAKTSWNLRRFLFKPRLGLRGIMRLDLFRGLTVLSGAGVGGGSLVYANTLIVPSPKAFGPSAWPTDVGVSDWQSELAADYRTAQQMLGVTRAPDDFPADRALRDLAREMGVADTYHQVDVGVYFGKPGVKAADPYFAGAGPERSGCIHCGACMVGCRHGAKNTLMKNYLHLAERRGAQIFADREVQLIRPLSGGGYEVVARDPGWSLQTTMSLTARRVIIAAGVLGSLRLMMSCQARRDALPRLSSTLGSIVRTNGESILGVRQYGSDTDFSKGVAIAAGFNPDPHTKIEAVRYPAGSDAMSLLSIPLIEGPRLATRLGRLACKIVREPMSLVRNKRPRRWARETVILLVMQTLESRMRLAWRRRLSRLGRRDISPIFEDHAPGRPPVLLPSGARASRQLAAMLGGEPGGSLADLCGMSLTAHVLGGCPIAADGAQGVIDGRHEVHGYPGLYVLGGAAVPANLGVNPSLTITAMAERAMRLFPQAGD